MMMDRSELTISGSRMVGCFD